jgi:formylglycine-generating enzyme required for sulfatase activity
MSLGLVLILTCPGDSRAGIDSLVKVIHELAAAGQAATLAGVLECSMATIPAGEFMMGSETGADDERPLHRVYLDAYQIDRYETTNAQYRQFIQATGRKAPPYWNSDDYPAGQAAYPVVGVSGRRRRPIASCRQTPAQRGRMGSCLRAGRGHLPVGDGWLPGRANLGLDQAANWPISLEDGWRLLQYPGQPAGRPSLRAVGSYLEGASYYGVLDMAGNAAEWVADWYNWEGYANLPSVNPVSAGPPWNHALRGSAWFDRRGQEGLVTGSSRCAARNSSHSDDDPRLGFRCARGRN